MTDASTTNGSGGARLEGGAAADRGNVGTIRTDAGAASAREAFPQCRFHFGTLEEIARNNSALLSEIDFFTPGWMGQNDQFDMGSVCENTKPGATFSRQIPVIVSYLAAFYAKRHMNLKDCNAPGSGQSLCQAGAQYIQQNLAAILASYESYAQGFANCYGTTKPIIFLMEPDFYQYTDSMQSMPWSQAQSGQVMGQFVAAMKKHLPNAIFSLDVSPWAGPNGGDNGQGWFSNFDMSQFTFISTSGGGTEANNMFIRSANRMTWAGVTQVTGKPMMADTGYGVNGMPAGPDAAWDSVSNINARIDDGVVSISQYSPSSSWASTIATMRSQLKAPRGCP